MCDFFKSSIGRKMGVAVTGLILFGFVVAHMLGNLQIFLGQEALNDYARHLHELPLLLWPARIFLLVSFVVHIALSLALAYENRKARPVPYAYTGTVQASYASITMVATGLVILLFVVYHLLHFTFGVTNPQFFHLVDSKGRIDVYSMMVLSYRRQFISWTYILAMAFLCLHLSHGLASFPQSLGIDLNKHERCMKNFATGLALAVFAGNSSIPLAVLLNFVKLPGGG